MKLRNGDRIVEIDQDIDPMDPREWDNLGVMVCFHRRYNLGDKHDLKSQDFNGWDDIESFLRDGAGYDCVMLPLYLYDHSGLRMKVGSFNGLLPQGHARWDSGQVGFIYAAGMGHDWTPEHKAKHYPDMTDEQILTKVLHAEVETYDQYLRGDIYHAALYRVETCNLGHEHHEIVDSCGGFYGVDLDHIGETLGIPDLTEWTEI